MAKIDNTFKQKLQAIFTFNRLANVELEVNMADTEEAEAYKPIDATVKVNGEVVGGGGSSDIYTLKIRVKYGDTGNQYFDVDGEIVTRTNSFNAPILYMKTGPLPLSCDIKDIPLTLPEGVTYSTKKPIFQVNAPNTVDGVATIDTEDIVGLVFLTEVNQ